MGKRNSEQRPEMTWHRNDMTVVMFLGKSFHAVVDKGLLDGLMVLNPVSSGASVVLYMSNVARILKPGGKFICFTVPEFNILGIVTRVRFVFVLFLAVIVFFHRISFHQMYFSISSGLDGRGVFIPFLRNYIRLWWLLRKIFVLLFLRSANMDGYSVAIHGDKALQLNKALEKERKFRSEYSGDSVLHALKDLNLGEFEEYVPGRRIKLILGEPEGPYFIRVYFLMLSKILSKILSRFPLLFTSFQER
ncbi:hypothetical protein ABFS83_09G018900 [Erythranthe nasuta]